MSTDIVIRAENLGKKYTIGHQAAERVPTLRDALARNASGFLRGAREMLHGRPIIAGDETEDFWALKDVNFEVGRGEVLGIIGRNGAGKSTLLKVLSRITEPSSGRVEIRGRVASLLEVGTGFHPELSGRENIYLNGAILGMSRREIKAKFDEIVAFSEVERFLDTPVKRYSSGMYVRLAFAVAAHLEPEILVVDEVLAVGDAEFQKKCLGKMHDVAAGGRTVLFVSHNLAAVAALCSRALLLSGGQLMLQGSTARVSERYLNTLTEKTDLIFAAHPTRPSITAIRVDREALKRGNLVVAIDFDSPRPIATPLGGLVLRAVTGEPLWGSNGRFHLRVRDDANGLSKGVLTCSSQELPLIPGNYTLSVWLADFHEDFDSKIDATVITIGDVEHAAPDALRPSPTVQGYLNWPATWSSEPC